MVARTGLRCVRAFTTAKANFGAAAIGGTEVLACVIE